jgi:hypothetical protein
MKPGAALYLVPLAIAVYSIALTALMLRWASRGGSSTKAYRRGIVLYALILALPTPLFVVPAAIRLSHRAGDQISWAFLLTTCILGQLLPLFATHGFCAMKWPEVWQKILVRRGISC